MTAVLSAACGGHTPSRSIDASPGQSSTAPLSSATNPSRSANVAPATAPGLAEAVMRHLRGQHAEVVGGGQNRDDGWTMVEFEAKTPGRTVELRLFVTNVEMTGLPVPVQALESMASDPHVGAQTTQQSIRPKRRTTTG